MAWKKHLTQEEKSAYHEKKQSEMSDLFQRIDEGVKAVFDSEKYKEYLRVMSKFTHYSAGNCMLIAMQKPDASLVAAYGKWKSLGRQVNRGETGIRILAPMPYKRKREEQAENEETEEIDGIAFKAVSVFDVSQTSGKELPEYIHDLAGEVESEQMTAVLNALRKVTGIPITFGKIPGDVHGYYSHNEDRIVIQTGMSDAQTLKTAFHECAHKLLHDKRTALPTMHADRSAKEVHAESVAFIVAEHFGLDTSEYSFPYIAGWSDGKPLNELNKALSEIQQASRILTDAVTHALTALEQSQKEENTVETEEEDDLSFSGIAM
ncbi:MAG: ssDNA-binding domain-containing protein [Oscillospiraceae bacterium]|nr:ssDNA-binding domain-containing protein [Oscillospiraceae bacterium]